MKQERLAMLAITIALALAVVAPAYAELIGGTVYVSGAGCRFPDAAYNSVDNKYLVVWPDYNSNPLRIYGRFVSNAGAPLGGAFPISDGSTYALYPAIAYNATNNEFLVTWDGGQGETCVGQRVRGSDGALLGGNFTIGTVYGGVRSSVAWSATSNTYLAVYAVGEVYGQLLSNTGAKIGGEINISQDVDYSGYPSVAWGSSSNQFLVTWDYNPNGTNWGYIAGRRVSADSGSLIGSRISITTVGYEDRSAVAYDTVNNRWLAHFNFQGNPGYSYDQYGQLVNADGTLYGGMIPVAHTPTFEGDTLVSTDIAFTPGYGGRFFSTFILDPNMGGQELYATGQLMGGQIALASGGGACNNAADTELNRFLSVWESYEGSVHYIKCQLYGATAAAAPSPVTNFVATAGNGQNVLTWTNPGEPSFTGTLIRFKTNGYPTGPTDGTQIYNSNGTNYTHSSLTNGVTYYYTAWAHDSTPNYATGVNAAGTPSATPGLQIIPQPQELNWKAGTGFLVNASTQIMANSGPDAREQNMAQQLQRKVWDMTGHLPAIVYGGSSTSNVIAVGTPARCPAVNSIIATWAEASGKASKSEGYMLGIKDTSIVIRGFDDPGSFYGSQTLIQLLEYFRTTTMSPVFIYDYPELAWRGTYFRMKFDHDISFSKELFAETFARYKMNRMCYDLWMKSISHPEIPDPNELPMPPVKAQEFINFCKLYYITDVDGSSWGNPLAGSLNDALRENPSLQQDDPLEQFCQRNPGTRTLMDQLWMDSINLFGSPYMHVGQSEYVPCDPSLPWDIGWSGCPYCAGYSNQWLYNDYLWQDRNNLVSHGVTPVVWGDMLRGDSQWGNGSASEWNTAGAVATMPGETIIFDWEYGTPSYTPTDYPSLDVWIANGQRACGTPYGFGNHPEYGQFYGDIDNIYYWANAVYNRSISYPNLMLGIVAFNKYNCYGKRDTLDNPLYMEFLETWPFYGEWGWNPNGRYWSPRPYSGKDMVRRELSPDRVSNFSAIRNGSNNDLAWTNPPDSGFAGAYVVYRTDRYPTSPIDGAYVADVSGSPSAAGSYTHVSGPSAAYYSVFSHDSVRHFSPSATGQVGVPVACLQEYFDYPSGALNGQGGWSGTASSSQIAVNSGYVQIIGGEGNYDAAKTVSCNADATGYITVTCKINGESGTDTTWNLWIDDTAGANFARWYGSSATARGRIGTTTTVTTTQNLSGGWEELKVKIHPVNNTTEFFFNGNSLGVYSHSVTGAGNTVGSLRFERISNSASSGQTLFFDELVIGEVASPDTTPPGPVTNFAATPGQSQITLSWTNPGDGDFAGTMIRFSTSGYPGSPSGGTECYNGTGTSTVHSGLTPGVTYYYTAFAYDGVPNYSSSVTASAVPPAPVNNAQYISDTIPTTMIAGQHYDVSVTMKNTGTTTWSYTDGYKLGAAGDSDPFAGTRHLLNPGETVAPNAQRTFSFTMTAPTTPATYTTDWRMLREGVEWFGDTLTKQVTVSAADEFCFQDEFNYSDGALVGLGGWTGNAGTSEIRVINNFVQVIGGSPARNALKTVDCTSSPTGLIWVRLLAYRGIGETTMWSVWINDTSGNNLARWYGSGTTARGRIGGTALVTSTQTLQGNGVWDSLVVKIDPAANTSQFYYNGADLGALSHSSTGAGDVVGQIMIERDNNNGASGHHMYIDNIRISNQ